MSSTTTYFNKVLEASATAPALVFLKSLAVQVYPCGNRRSYEDSGSGDVAIPFDPEARLNTEANNRRHASTNGFEQTFLKIDEGAELIKLVIAGYSFRINASSTDFYKDFNLALTDDEDANNNIYANIRIKTTKLYADNSLDYTTEVLSPQALDLETSPDVLDVFGGDESANYNEPDNYYFSGLSFSIKPLADINSTETRVSSKSDDFITLSLKIFDTDGEVHQPALLPNIKHGTSENSIILGAVESDSVTTKTIKAEKLEYEYADPTDETKRVNFTVPAINLKELTDDVDGADFQLQFMYNTSTASN